jgi:DNA-directed RNA polymerase specialized sigma24 family protein
MGQPMHPAVQLLVDAVRSRLDSPGLPESAVRGAVLEALQAAQPPEGRLSPWVTQLTWDSASILCRRLGVVMPDLPSIIPDARPIRDLASETVQALFNELDPRHAAVLRMLEVKDARESQVAVVVGIPPKRIGVIARQGRAQLAAVLERLAAEP